MRYRQRNRLVGCRGMLRRMLNSDLRVSQGPAAIHGNMRRAVVVKSPDERFTEAVFILKDCSAREEGISNTELLRQAKEAAEGYAAAHFSQRRGGLISPAAIFICGAAAAVLALWAVGLF